MRARHVALKLLQEERINHVQIPHNSADVYALKYETPAVFQHLHMIFHVSSYIFLHIYST